MVNLYLMWSRWWSRLWFLYCMQCIYEVPLISSFTSVFNWWHSSRDRHGLLVVHAIVSKGGEIRDTKTLNLSRNIVAFQVFGRCFSFFTLQDQLVAQQKHLLRVEEMQHADWLICSVWIQDGGITTNLLRDKLRV